MTAALPSAGRFADLTLALRSKRRVRDLVHHPAGRRRGVTVRVHGSNADMRCLVLPMRPEGTEGWDAEKLAGIVTRDCMAGTALPGAAAP